MSDIIKRPKNFDQISQSSAEILLLPVPENKRRPYWNYIFGFNFDLLLSFAYDFVWPTRFYARWMIAVGFMTSCRFYKMAAITSQIYFRFLVWPRLKFQKVQSYWHTTLRPDISIHGPDITTSGSWKANGRHVEILLQFQFWFFSLSLACDSAILCKTPTELKILQDGGHSVENLLPVLVWLRLTFKKVQSYWHTILIHGRCINTSCFWKQTVAILKFYFRFQFWRYTVIGVWFSVGIPNFIRIGSSAAELWRHSDFQDGGRRQLCWIWLRVMVH